MADVLFDKICNRYFYNLNEELANIKEQTITDMQTKLKENIEKFLKIKNVVVTVNIVEEPEYRLLINIYLTKEYSLNIEMNKDLQIIRGIKSSNEFYKYGDENISNTVKILYAFMASKKFIDIFKNTIKEVLNKQATENRTANEVEQTGEQSKEKPTTQTNNLTNQ